jgi:uncharacterized membrane protein
MAYFWLKLIHIVSSTLLFGTGLGSAFYMYRADRSGDIHAIVFAARNVVLADWLFTTPAVIVQPLTGFALIHLTHYSLTSLWILLSLLLYLVAGACWLPVVWLQMQMYKLAQQALLTQSQLPSLYHRYMRIWFWLGWPAFIAVLIIFLLMTFKPA